MSRRNAGGIERYLHSFLAQHYMEVSGERKQSLPAFSTWIKIASTHLDGKEPSVAHTQKVREGARGLVS
jgi:hypothetical protein